MKEDIERSIAELIHQKHYPCVAAIQSHAKKDYRIGVYKSFGEGVSSQDLAQDLIDFREEYRRTRSSFLSFFAVFEGATEFSEELFEAHLWKELSYLSGEDHLRQSWDPHFSEDPESKNFCFSLDGTAFFVVGMHKNSSRKGRQFHQPMLVFNIYDQFRELQNAGKYENMVRLIRSREVAFQGDVNPMTLAHGDVWEAIQFSGKNNSQEWKCPFQRGLKKSPGSL